MNKTKHPQIHSMISSKEDVFAHRCLAHAGQKHAQIAKSAGGRDLQRPLEGLTTFLLRFFMMFHNPPKTCFVFVVLLHQKYLAKQLNTALLNSIQTPNSLVTNLKTTPAVDLRDAKRLELRFGELRNLLVPCESGRCEAKDRGRKERAQSDCGMGEFRDV